MSKRDSYTRLFGEFGAALSDTDWIALANDSLPPNLSALNTRIVAGSRTDRLLQFSYNPGPDSYTFMSLSGGCVAEMLDQTTAHCGTFVTSYGCPTLRVILIASNFGGSRNPAWYHNVKANPLVTLYGRGIRGRFVAEEICDAERDRLFQRAKDAPGPYGQYEQAAAAQSRYVPVIAFTAQSRPENQVDLPPTPRSHRTRKGTS